MGFRPHRNLTRSRTGVPVGSRVPRDRKRKGTPIGMKKLMAYVLAAFLLGGVAMGKGTSAARNAKGAKSGGAQITAVEGRARTPSASQGGRVSSRAVTGNLSKLRRERLLSHIAAIKTFLERSVGTDTNAVRLLSFAVELEKEARGKKYGLVFEEHRERVDVELDENIPVLEEMKGRFLAARNAKSAKDEGVAHVAAEAPLNFLIEGDNLAALKLLEKTHRGRIDLIYIDPPYNTGNEDFIYNDSYVDKTDTFRHSKWLSFMQKRLEIARLLMSDSALIFLSIDDNEQAALKLLCDEVFDEANRIAVLPTIMNLKGNQDEFGFAGTHEYTLVYAKNKAKCVVNLFPVDEEDMDAWQEDEIGYFKKGATLKRTGKDAPRESRPWGYFPILVNRKSKQVSVITESEYEQIYDGKNKAFDDDYVLRLKTDYEKRGYEVLLPTIGNMKASWRWQYSTVKNNPSEIIVVGEGGSFSLYKKQRPQLGDMPTAKPKTTFYKPQYSSGNGTSQLKAILGSKLFDNPKPVELIKDFMLLGSDKNDIVLDFFAGSGTTGHAVMKLNAEDGGRRRFILVTNNENGICEKVTYERLKRVMAKEKYAARLKYYKVGYVPITEDGYWERADALLGYIRELVELENGIDFSHDTSVAIVLTDVELGRFVKGLAKKTALPRILYKGHNVILDAKAKAAIEKQGVEVKTIPDYYYPELED